jgi:hypothetical protein
MSSLWFRRLLSFMKRSTQRSRPRNRAFCQLRVEALEDRALLAVNLISHDTGLNFAQSGGYIPPDTNGAAVTTIYVETLNQAISINTPKGTGVTSPTVMHDLAAGNPQTFDRLFRAAALVPKLQLGNEWRLPVDEADLFRQTEIGSASVPSGKTLLPALFSPVHAGQSDAGAVSPGVMTITGQSAAQADMSGTLGPHSPTPNFIVTHVPTGATETKQSDGPLPHGRLTVNGTDHQLLGSQSLHKSPLTTSLQVVPPMEGNVRVRIYADVTPFGSEPRQSATLTDQSARCQPATVFDGALGDPRDSAAITAVGAAAPETDSIIVQAIPNQYATVYSVQAQTIEITDLGTQIPQVSFAVDANGTLNTAALISAGTDHFEAAAPGQVETWSIAELSGPLANGTLNTAALISAGTDHFEAAAPGQVETWSIAELSGPPANGSGLTVTISMAASCPSRSANVLPNGDSSAGSQKSDPVRAQNGRGDGSARGMTDADATAARQPVGQTRAHAKALALGLRALDPELTDEQIAKEAGCSRRQLYRWNEYRALKKLLCESGRIPHGSKDRQSGLEAWADEEDE